MYNVGTKWQKDPKARILEVRRILKLGGFSDIVLKSKSLNKFLT